MSASDELTMEQAKQMIRELKTEYDEIDNITAAIGLDYNGPLWRTIVSVWDVAVNRTADMMGISHGSLTWFIYKNNWGENGCTRRYGGQDYPISSIGDLLRLERMVEKQ